MKKHRELSSGITAPFIFCIGAILAAGGSLWALIWRPHWTSSEMVHELISLYLCAALIMFFGFVIGRLKRRPKA